MRRECKTVSTRRGANAVLWTDFAGEFRWRPLQRRCRLRHYWRTTRFFTTHLSDDNAGCLPALPRSRGRRPGLRRALGLGRPARRPLARLEPPLNPLAHLLGLGQTGSILDGAQLVQDVGLDHEGAAFLHGD